jgi:hypothetical protein
MQLGRNKFSFVFVVACLILNSIHNLFMVQSVVWPILNFRVMYLAHTRLEYEPCRMLCATVVTIYFNAVWPSQYNCYSTCWTSRRLGFHFKRDVFSLCNSTGFGVHPALCVSVLGLSGEVAEGGGYFPVIK